MSRAFVKEDGPEPSDDPPERPVSPHPNYVTRRGLSLLQDEEERLFAVHAKLPPGKTDPAVRRRKLEIERDVRYVRARIESAIPVDPASPPPAEVRFGARVVLRREDGAERTLRIVGEDEAREGGEFVPWTAPFVAALLGLKAGAEIVWESESVTERWTVVSVSYP